MMNDRTSFESYEPSYSNLRSLHMRERYEDVMLVCDNCGAMVGDTEIHDEWHQPSRKDSSNE